MEQSILQRTQVTPEPQMVIPASDPNAGTGLKDVAFTVQALLEELAAAQSGSQIYTGAASPSELLGNNGDYYIDTANGALFGPKANGLWPTTAIVLTSASDATLTAALATETSARVAGDEANAASISNLSGQVAANATAIAGCLVNTNAAFQAAYLAWMASLPTVATSPVWNNNGTPMQA